MVCRVSRVVGHQSKRLVVLWIVDIIAAGGALDTLGLMFSTATHNVLLVTGINLGTWLIIE
jgi:hypothetical protein